MARVYPQPQAQASSSSSSSSFLSSSPLAPARQREVFTIWMKSLVLNGNGCAVYDSKGCLAYRVDNYDCRRGGDEVYLMDLAGRVLFRILQRKRLRILGGWEGYKYTASQQEEHDPSFTAKKHLRILNGDPACEVTVVNADGRCYRIEGLVCKSAYRITDVTGELVVAEVKRKQTASGVILGEDVLTMLVEPNSDLSLIMALVVVCGLISHSL